jgi:hypothetical protein
VGKKPKGPYAGKSLVFSTRITPDLRAKLGTAASERGYSLSQEIEERLRDSFILEQRIAESFGSMQNYLILRIVALAMQWAQVAPNHTAYDMVTDWMNDQGKFDVVVSTVVNVLEAIRPAQRPEMQDVPKDVQDKWDEWKVQQRALDEFSSKQIPAAIWKAIQGADAAAPIGNGTREEHLMGLLKRRLGTIADRPHPQLLAARDLDQMLDAQTVGATTKKTPGHRGKKRTPK